MKDGVLYVYDIICIYVPDRGWDLTGLGGKLDCHICLRDPQVAVRWA